MGRGTLIAPIIVAIGVIIAAISAVQITLSGRKKDDL